VPKLALNEIRKLGLSIFERLGAPTGYSELVVDTLIEANLVGHDSHGIRYIPIYAERIKKGIINPKSKPEVTKETPSTALIDGNWTFGQATAMKTVEVAIEKAKRTSISAVGAFHCNHIGRLGAYTMMAAENDMIGILTVNVVHPIVQPFGGASRVFGTNPISIATPAGEMKPFLLDFATSAVAEGKVGFAAVSGEKVPLGWIVDKYGQDTDNPLDFSTPNGSVGEDGRLLSFGARDGHKGYCLSFLMEILGGILTGAGSIAEGEPAHLYENGLLAIVLDIRKFTPVKVFKKRIDSLIRRIHQEPVETGFQYSEVQVPGQFEWRNREKHLTDGIDVPKPVWEQIVNLAHELRIEIKDHN
jgi:LDH2 family malate/lactate/ureidoglycolate dehydrogenase